MAPMLWRESEHEPLTERAWTAGWAQEALQEIVADAETAASPTASGRFTRAMTPRRARCGAASTSAPPGWPGRCGSSTLRLTLASAVANALERYHASPDFTQDPHPPSLLCGETGILVAAERVGSPAGDRERLRELIRANRSHPTWELLWGSPGTMLAARALRLRGRSGGRAPSCCGRNGTRRPTSGPSTSMATSSNCWGRPTALPATSTRCAASWARRCCASGWRD